MNVHDRSVVLPQVEDLEFSDPATRLSTFVHKVQYASARAFNISQLKTLLSPTAPILSACPTVLMDQVKYEQPEEMHRQASTLTH